MTQDVRCGAKLHARLISSTTVEIKCDSRFCGAGKGIVVLHTFDLHTGDMIGTRRFKAPPIVQKGRNLNGHAHHGAAVRTP